MLKKIAILTLTLLLLHGCTGKQLISEKNQESALITIKTPKMKYSDMGFIYKKSDLVKVEIYSMGQPLVSIDINALNICMSLFKCMEKKDFNANVLHSSYPDTLLENIFQGNAIFEKRGITQNSNGFTQNIKKEDLYDITYSVISSERIFRDKINKILIKVKPQ
ncbi:MAG: hypothetical protein K0U38_02795 [Epsilonproteobacteria bacterium]|nr:hypothetical protein [Campylobacterota bacterium]